MPKQRYQTIGSGPHQAQSGHWYIRAWVDVIENGAIMRKQRRFVLGPASIGKREATKRGHEILARINNADYIVKSQIPLGEFVKEYRRRHIAKLAWSTQAKYECHIEKHILPAFGAMALCDITTARLQDWLDAKKLAWSTRVDLKNILSSMFSKAIDWGLWKERNPVEAVSAGRKRLVREKRKLTDEQTRQFLGALDYELRVLCCTGLFCALRISEILGLQEKHLDFARGMILIRQRYYRGNIDEPKNSRARRDVPMGHLLEDLRRMTKGDPERFVFQIQTHPLWGNRTSTSRDDRDLNQHFLRPAAKKLGFYWPGFGFHSLRREAITAIGAIAGLGQAMGVAGHSSVDMSLLYTLEDVTERDRAIRAHQERILGPAPDGKPN